jgi:CRISPR-associated protein Cmr4
MSDTQQNKPETNNPNPNTTDKPMITKILYLFTRTPLHVGAGASVGAIDQPIIPATSLKGTFADEWNEVSNGKIERSEEGKWLFGETDANNAAAGAVQFTEAKLLAFPVRSAKGSFAWITCPLILCRAVRDGVVNVNLDNLRSLTDEKAIYDGGNGSPIDLGGKIVLEEYTFTQGGVLPNGLGQALAGLIQDKVWAEVASRLVILSDGMMSFFVQNACEVAQHVRIDDATGTAAQGALFNQENVPSETLFYSVVHFLPSRARGGNHAGKTANDAEVAFRQKLNGNPVFQFGGDASTGLGYCTVKLS